MDTLQIIVFSVILALTVVFVKETEPKIGAVMTLAASLWLLFVCIRELSSVTEYLRAERFGSVSDYLPYILKSLCIGLCAHTASEICADAGERSIASRVSMLGKLGILTVCLPLIKSVLNTALSFVR